MRITPILLLTLFLAVASPALAAQESPHGLFERGLVLERSAGDVVGAVALYKRLLREHGDERELAARALLQLGSAYERLGHPGAADAYRRVLEEYPDRREARQRAAAALSALGAPVAVPDVAVPDPTYTLLLDDLPARAPEGPAGHDVSPDGRQIVFVGNDPEHPRVTSLLLSDRSGAVVRTLVRSAADGLRGFRSPRWSPDGRSILFFGREEDGEGTHGIYVIAATGGEPRLVVGPGPFRYGAVWTPDGRGITYGRGEPGEIRSVRLDEPSSDVRIEGPELDHTARIGGHSPDGRWLALDLPLSGDQRHERDVWLVPSGGGRALQVTHAPGIDGQPTWGPDGRLHFVSERSGSSNVWRMTVDSATGLRRGEPEQVTSYEDALLLHPRVTDEGGVTYVLRRNRGVIRVAPADRPSEIRHLTRGTQPKLSPNGRTVVYEGQGPDLDRLFALPVEGGAPRRLTEARMFGSENWTISPDGRDVAFVADTEGGRALFRVPVDGGRPVKLADLEPDESTAPPWSPDGSRIAFIRGSGVYAVDRQGGEPVRLASLWRWDPWTLRWSPDGQHLAALGWAAPPEQRGEHQNDVFLIPTSGGEPRRISGQDEDQYKEFVDWRPDAAAVTYMYYDPSDPPRAGDSADGLRIAYVDGRPSEPFLDRPETWDYWGVWAPDGQSLVFYGSRNNGSGWGLYRRDTRTGRVTPFSDGDGSLPSWSRDGRTVAWHVSDVTSQLWMVEPER